MIPSTKILLAGAVLASASAGCLISAGPASAAVPGLELVSTEGGPASIISKSVTVMCPAGKKVIGTGGAILGAGEGDVMIVDITPLPALDGVRVVGAEVALGTTDAWSIKAYATCAIPPPGLQLVSATSPSNSMAKGLVLSCPAGKKVLGVGGEISDGETGWIGLQRLKFETASSVRVRGTEISVNGTDSNWKVTAHAICANPLPGHQIVSATTANDSTNAKSIYRACPVGKKAVGAGGDVDSTPHQRAVLDEIVPVPNLAGVNVVSSEPLFGTTLPWNSKVFVVCANA